MKNLWWLVRLMGYRNLGEFWFGWMKVVLNCLGEEFLWFGGKLREIWRFEGFMAMEVVEGCLRNERCLCWRMKGEEGKKIRYMVCRGQARRCHYRHGPCQGCGLWGFCKAWSGTAVPLQARAVPGFWQFGLNFFFFVFFESCSDNYLQNNLKQTKTNKKRLNAWVASHEALV